MIFLFFSNIWGWLERLGGLGLILLGFADNSPFPLPGSMDALTIILSAHQKSWWPYYGLMATIGGIVGGYATYALAREGGKEGLEKKLSRKKAEQAYRIFNKYGFWSLFVPALLPPPVPFSPFIIASGALNYSRKSFLLAVGIARSIRYLTLAYLGSRYSRQIFGFFQKYYRPMLWSLVTLAVLGGILVGIYLWQRKKKGRPIWGGSKNVKAA